MKPVRQVSARTLLGKLTGRMRSLPHHAALPLVPLLVIAACGGVFDAEFHQSAKRGDTAALEARLAVEGNVLEGMDKMGRTPLHGAAVAGQVEAVRLLLKRGASPDVYDCGAKTPLMHAVDSGRTDIVAALIQAGADVNRGQYAARIPTVCDQVVRLTLDEGRAWLDRLGGTLYSTPQKLNSLGPPALHRAIISGQAEVVKLLLDSVPTRNHTDAGARMREQEWPPDSDLTPLLYAVMQDNPIFTQYLIASKVKNNAIGYSKLTALLLAARFGTESFLLLLNAGSNLAILGGDGANALHEVCTSEHHQSHWSLGRSLIYSHDVPSHWYKPVSHKANWEVEEVRRRDIVQLLLSKGFDVNSKTAYDETPLHFAAEWDHPLLVALLLERGASVDAKTDRGATPLLYAMCAGTQVAKALLERGADANSTSGSGLTPLLAATDCENLPLVELLLTSGSDSNAKWTKEGGKTALHMAAAAGNVALAEVLLKHKANANLTDDDGLTPLQMAAKECDAAMARVLVAGGADKMAKDGDGKAPAELVPDPQTPECLKARREILELLAP